MESNRINLSFEYDLFNVNAPVWIERVLRPSVEPLYFYCDERLPLATELEYDRNFLKKVDASIVRPDEDSLNWWGQHSDIAKKSNCKLENHKLNQALGLWTPAGGIVTSFDELDALMTEGRWRLKDPWLMGGTGQWRIDREMLHEQGYRKGIEERLKKGALLLEKTLDVVKVLGTTFKLDSKASLLFTVENFINSQGNFQGGQLSETPHELVQGLNQVAQHWYSQGARGVLEIDSFILADGHYLCVEVNHRKTMGWFIWKLTHKFGPGSLVFGSTEGLRLNPANAPIAISWLRT